MAILVYYCEMDLACHYAIHRSDLARECANRAREAAIQMHRPDLAYLANELMGLV